MQRDQPALHLRTDHHSRMEYSTMLTRIPEFRPTMAALARAPVRSAWTARTGEAPHAAPQYATGGDGASIATGGDGAAVAQSLHAVDDALVTGCSVRPIRYVCGYTVTAD